MNLTQFKNLVMNYRTELLMFRANPYNHEQRLIKAKELWAEIEIQAKILVPNVQIKKEHRDEKARVNLNDLSK